MLQRIILGLLAAGPLLCDAASATTCESLRGFSSAGFRIDAATSIAPAPKWIAEPGARPVTQPFCRVQGTIEKEIGFELWLPSSGHWNGKYLGAGVGGDAGAFNFLDLPRGLARGYAAATTDSGHKLSDRQWMLGDPERLSNFEHRAHHLLAVTSKQIISSYYAKAPAHSFFIGCSGGGRQGLKEAQLYPGDYDGIIVGAPGPKTASMSARRLWEINLHRKHPGLMAAADWQFVADAASKQCDGQDGVVDGIVNNPRRCHFDASSLLCTTGSTTGDKPCLSERQVRLVRTIYAPLQDENGQRIDNGLLPGVRVTPLPESRLAPALFGQAVHRSAAWDLTQFSIAGDLEALNKAMPGLAADDANLQPFRDAGGKLIIYQGWLDPAVAADMSIAYVETVMARTKDTPAVDAFLRLYLAPGVLHCRGGNGPDQFGGSGSDAPVVDADHDLLSALERWVEQGVAPSPIVASQWSNGRVFRTRPLCPYPEEVRYRGSGDPDVADSFQCERR